MASEVTGEGAPHPAGPFSPAQAAVLSGLSSQKRAKRAQGALGLARGSQRGLEAWGRGVLGLRPTPSWGLECPGPLVLASLLTSCHLTTERAYVMTVSTGLPRRLSRSVLTIFQRPQHAGIASWQALCLTAASLPPHGRHQPTLPEPAPKPLPPWTAQRPPGMDTRGSSSRVTVPGPHPS